jgi:hypothetical protein
MRRLLSTSVGLIPMLRGVAALMLVGICQPSLLPVGTALANTSPEDVTEENVLASVHGLYGGSSKVIAHLPLTEAFTTASQWELVVAKETDLAAEEFGDPNPTTICFVQNGKPNCTERALFPIASGSINPNGRLFYEFRGARVVYAGTGRTSPLLMITACSQTGVNGNCGIHTLLFRYDESSEQFHLVFHDVVPRNNNGATRFIEMGPLRGYVVSVAPTSNAPYGYFVSVYRQDETGGFVQMLRYRSKTHYNDGNRLAVADSDMPEILRQLGLWKSADPLPAPSVLPRGCTKLVLRKGEEWCE